MQDFNQVNMLDLVSGDCFRDRGRVADNPSEVKLVALAGPLSIWTPLSRRFIVSTLW